jgi:hypothetical protein
MFAGTGLKGTGLKGTGFKGMRRTIIAAGAALTLGIGAAVWAATSASAASAAPAAVPRCQAGDLGVWVNPDTGDQAAGHSYLHLAFTNLTHHTCYLAGYPGVSAVNSIGKQLGKPARLDSTAPFRVIDIAPDATAHAILTYVDIVVDPTCKPANAAVLKVYPPNDFGARHAFFDDPVCTKAVTDLAIARVQAGA